MKSVLILAFSDLRHDARITRQIEFLSSDYRVTVVCFETIDSKSFEAVVVARTKLTPLRKGLAAVLLLSGLYKAGHRMLFGYSFIKSLLKGRRFDLVIANDAESLPFAFEYGDAKVLFDAHEYSPRQYEDKLVWRIFFQGMYQYLCRKFIPRVTAMTTVGQGLADEYEKNFGKKPIVVTNAPAHSGISPSPLLPGKIRIIHHGGATVSRKLEYMIEMMDLLDERFSLDMMLITPPNANARTKSYLGFLTRLAGLKKNVRILPPIPSSAITGFINQYDIGLYLLPPLNFNSENTLPNKFFDFIQARLAIAVGPSPEMSRIVQEYNIGVVSHDFTPESLAAELNRLTHDQIKICKENTAQAALRHSAQVNKEVMLRLVNELTT